jgi:hypothetical protein
MSNQYTIILNAEDSIHQKMIHINDLILLVQT